MPTEPPSKHEENHVSATCSRLDAFKQCLSALRHGRELRPCQAVFRIGSFKNPCQSELDDYVK